VPPERDERPSAGAKRPVGVAFGAGCDSVAHDGHRRTGGVALLDTSGRVVVDIDPDRRVPEAAAPRATPTTA
jgi:hypothetical protein